MLTVVDRVLSSALSASVGQNERTRLGEARARVGDGSIAPLLDAYARASMMVGRVPLALTDQDVRQLGEAAPEVGFARWATDDAARVLLLMTRRQSGRTGRRFVADGRSCFEEGDAREQQSFLKAIALWPEAAEFLPIAVDSCRTNIIPVFEALACENPYPARHFPDLNFNQMILKALFNSIALSRVVGLGPRLNAELARMARDYAAERTAAGRTVPPDIGLAIQK